MEDNGKFQDLSSGYLKFTKTDYISVVVNCKSVRFMTLVNRNNLISDLIKEIENTFARLYSVKVKIQTLKNSVNAIMPHWYPVFPLIKDLDEVFAFTDNASDSLSRSGGISWHGTTSPAGSVTMADSGFTSPVPKAGVSGNPGEGMGLPEQCGINEGSGEGQGKINDTMRPDNNLSQGESNEILSEVFSLMGRKIGNARNKPVKVLREESADGVSDSSVEKEQEKMGSRKTSGKIKNIQPAQKPMSRQDDDIDGGETIVARELIGSSQLGDKMLVLGKRKGNHQRCSDAVESTKNATNRKKQSQEKKPRVDSEKNEVNQEPQTQRKNNSSQKQMKYRQGRSVLNTSDASADDEPMEFDKRENKRKETARELRTGPNSWRKKKNLSQVSVDKNSETLNEENVEIHGGKSKLDSMRKKSEQNLAGLSNKTKSVTGRRESESSGDSSENEVDVEADARNDVGGEKHEDNANVRNTTVQLNHMGETQDDLGKKETNTGGKESNPIEQGQKKTKTKATPLPHKHFTRSRKTKLTADLGTGEKDDVRQPSSFNESINMIVVEQEKARLDVKDGGQQDISNSKTGKNMVKNSDKGNAKNSETNSKASSTKKAQSIRSKDESSSDSSSSDSDFDEDLKNVSTKRNGETQQDISMKTDGSSKNENVSMDNKNFPTVRNPGNTQQSLRNEGEKTKAVKSSDDSESSWTSSDEDSETKREISKIINEIHSYRGNDEPQKRVVDSDENEDRAAQRRKTTKAHTNKGSKSDGEGISTVQKTKAVKAGQRSKTTKTHTNKGSKSDGEGMSTAQRTKAVKNDTKGKGTISPPSQTGTLGGKKIKDLSKSTKASSAVKGVTHSLKNDAAKDREGGISDGESSNSSGSAVQAPLTQQPVDKVVKSKEYRESESGNSSDGKDVKNIKAQPNKPNTPPRLPQTPRKSTSRKSSGDLSANKVASWLLANPLTENAVASESDSSPKSKARAQKRSKENASIAHSVTDGNEKDWTVESAKAESQSQKRRLEDANELESNKSKNKKKSSDSKKQEVEEETSSEDDEETFKIPLKRPPVKTNKEKSTKLSLPKVSKGLSALVDDESEDSTTSKKRRRKQKLALQSQNRLKTPFGFLKPIDRVGQRSTSSKSTKLARAVNGPSTAASKTVEMNDEEKELLDSGAVNLDTLLNDENIKW